MNTQVGEQTFTWLYNFKHILCAMPKVHHLFYLHQMVVRRNFILQNAISMARNLFYPINSGYSLAMLIFHLYHTSHSVGIVVPDFPDFRELNVCITILNNVWLIPAAPSRPHRPIAQRVRRSSTCKSHKRKTAGNCSPQATRTNGIHNLQCVVRWFCD